MKFVSNFEIKAWDVAEDAGAAEISDISRVALRKEFDGELKGKSVGY